MIKYLGSIGGFIRLNDSEDKTYQLLNVYSSSVANLSLFSASINNLNGTVIFDSASTSLYINGISGSVVPNQQWAHFTFSFQDKLSTYDTNNFLIRFGDSASSNFNLQNVYILENATSNSDILYLHQEFTGGTNTKLIVPPSASYAINIIDYPESKFTSASTNIIYQPFYQQKKYLTDIVAATENSLLQFISASVMTNDDLYVDTVNLNIDDKVLSLLDDQIYQVTSSSQLKIVSSSVGDIVKVLYGQYFNNMSFIKTASGFNVTSNRPKINIYMNTI